MITGKDCERREVVRSAERKRARKVQRAIIALEMVCMFRFLLPF